MREVCSVRERERERDRRKWRHLSSAEIGEEVCTFPCQNAEIGEEFCTFLEKKFAPQFLPSYYYKIIGAEFTLSFAKNVALFSKQFAIFRKFALFAIVLPQSNGVTGDRSNETNDQIFGCTVLLLIEKMNQLIPKTIGKRIRDCEWGCARG